MSFIALVVVISLLFIFLIMIASVWVMNGFLKVYIGSKHRTLEAITSTGNVPAHWSKKFDNKIAAMNRNGESAENIAKIRMDAQKTYIRKLDRLMKYIDKTRLVADEETRDTLRSRLQQIRSRWEESE